MLASRLLSLHRAALRHPALFKEDFDSGFFFFCSQLVSHFLYLAVHDAFLDFNTALSSQ